MQCGLLSPLCLWTKIMNYLVLSPVTINLTRNEVYIQKSWHYILYCVIFTAMHFCRLCYILVMFINAIGFNSFVNMTYYMIALSLVFCAVIRIIEGYNANKSLLIKIINTVTKINESLSQIKVVSYNRLKRIILYELWTISLAYFCKTMTSLFYSKFTVLGFITPAIFYIIQIFHYYNYIWVVNDCLKNINDTLGYLKARKCRTFTLKQVVVLKQCHGDAMISICYVEKIFKIQNLAYIVALFTEMTQLTYFLLKKVFDLRTSPDYTILSRLLFVLWPGILLSMLVFVIKISGILNREIENSSDVVSEFRRNCTDEKLQDEVSLQVILCLCGKKYFCFSSKCFLCKFCTIVSSCKGEA